MPQVCVRFAPSPTGEPHVGNAYIALFDYAFARACEGRFVFRIEDTDRERSRPEYEERLMRAIRWLGLDWDEGPDKGGPRGPYRQSERCAIYHEHAWNLVAKGAAYPCFCAPQRLEQVREQQVREKRSMLGYDGLCRGLAPAEARRRAQAGEPHVIRLAVPREGQTSFDDLIRGEIVFRNAEIDDQILLKSDGFPTYHLACVVDDHLMEVTHVIRAEEWISSTPKHILLYQAFGWTPPRFIHMPLLRNTDKSKMSKRKNPTSLDWYREQGFLPEAMVNFLALMGFSMGEDREVFSLSEFIANFDLKRVGTGAPVFDMTKLEWLNGEYIRGLSPEDLARRLREGPLAGRDDVDDATLRKIVPLVRERMKKLSDFGPLTDFLFAKSVSPSVADMVPKKGTPAATADALEQAAAVLQGAAEWQAGPLEATARQLCDRLGWKPRDFFMPIRVAVTGSPVSPPLFESVEVLGREKTLARLRQAAAMLKSASGC